MMILNAIFARRFALAGMLISTFGPAFAADKPLPHPAQFEPARYLGFWHEVARFPAPNQPDDTLATADYRATKQVGHITVKNTSYNRDGKLLSAITGEADLAAGDPPGRLLVRFGPVAPSAPNYYVIHVDPDYRYAVVGVPSRKSLWILSRDVPVAPDKLKELVAIAKTAGFDTDMLRVAPWKQPVPAPASEPEGK